MKRYRVPRKGGRIRVHGRWVTDDPKGVRLPDSPATRDRVRAGDLEVVTPSQRGEIDVSTGESPNTGR